MKSVQHWAHTPFTFTSALRSDLVSLITFNKNVFGVKPKLKLRELVEVLEVHGKVYK